MRRTGWLSVLICLGLGHAPAQASINCYEAGNAELRADKPRFDIAAAAFESAARVEICLPAAGRLYTSAGHAYRDQARASRDPIWYCKAVSAWRSAIKHTRRQDRVDDLRRRLAADEEACVVEAPAGLPAGPPKDSAPEPETTTPASRRPTSPPDTVPPDAAPPGGVKVDNTVESDETPWLWFAVGGGAALAVGVGVAIWLLADEGEQQPVNSLELGLGEID